MGSNTLRRINLSGGTGRRCIIYPATPVDLRNITWDFHANHSTAGAAPKAFYKGDYYKMSSFNRDCGFYGDEAVTECVVSDILDTMGVPHIKYSLVMGRVVYHGREYITPVCISSNFNTALKPVTSLERYLMTHCPTLSPLEACVQLGWSDYVSTMFLVDFLILNRDRHGANVEIIEGKPVPLFDHGASLVTLQDYSVWNHWSGDKVNNFVGSFSLKENLNKITLKYWPQVKAPDVSVLERFSEFWPVGKIAFVQRMLQERWEYVEQRREELR